MSFFNIFVVLGTFYLRAIPSVSFRYPFGKDKKIKKCRFLRFLHLAKEDA